MFANQPETTVTKLCINCAHHYIPPGLRLADYNAHMCAKGAQRSLVTGAPISVLENCSTRRADSGDCKPEALLYAPELTAADFNLVTKPADLSVDSHCLNKTTEQGGAGSCKAWAEDAVDLCDSGAHVVTDIPRCGICTS